MAPSPFGDDLERRQYYCPSGFNYSNGGCYRNSTWNSWGRWVALAAIIIFFAALFFIISCVNLRRRRSAGLAPRYGTGWLATGKNGQPQQNYGQTQNYGQPANGHYYNQQQQQPGAFAPPAPPYSPPVNQGYYGGQQSGIELQQPQNAYAPPRADESGYAPPSGPPPGKGGYGGQMDGVVR